MDTNHANDAANSQAETGVRSVGKKKNAVTVDWANRHQTAAVVVAFLLTLLYVSPIIIVAIAAASTDGFQEPSLLFSWFASFMKSSDSTLNGVHKVLFPFMSTLSIIAFKDKISALVIALGIFILSAFMLSVFVSVFFEMTQTVTALIALPDKVDISAAKSFFSKIQETLLMYLMTLLGISAISEPTKKRGKGK